MIDLSNSIVKRLESTPKCREWVQKLREIHGDLMFYQSGGCCEGSAPLCLKDKEMRIGSNDVLLGYIEESPFYISGSQFEKWKHTKLTIDVVEGGGNAFSIESPEGISFHLRSQVFSNEQLAEIEKESL